MFGYLIEIKNCKLYISTNSASRIASYYGTPVYVYDEDTIYLRSREVKAFTDSIGGEAFYSVKANFNPHIISTMLSLGFGLETVSPGELYLASKMNIEPSKVMFTGSSVSIRDLEAASRFGAKINIDSLSAAKKLCKLGYNDPVGIRVNPMFGVGHHEYTVTGGIRSKFGVPLNHLNEIYVELESCGIRIERLHGHIGSGISSTEPYLKLFSILVNAARKKNSIEEIDIGGGFAIPYREEKERFPWKKFREELKEKIDELGADNYKIIIEPGRYLVGEAGLLLAEVTEVRELDGTWIVGTDTGMNHLIRPPLYNSYHKVSLTEDTCRNDLIKADIVGNICESSDYIARDIVLPRPKEGEIIAIMNAGAYGFSMSSNYNLRERPPEIYVRKNGRVILTRKRESIEDFIEKYFQE